MAEAEQGDKGATSQRKKYQQTRPIYSNRGRGRYDPHVSKALHNFGVTDLREWLDKKHQQEGEYRSSAPPPDPSYNYLKDPSRENSNYDGQTQKYQKERPQRTADSWSRGHPPRGSRGRGASMSRGARHPENEKTTFIQNPINIKIELQTATGERSYKLDEETKLADIKHIPDRKQQERRSFRSERGRGESGRGKGPRGDDSRDKNQSERGRGEGGRGGRGRGRGRGGRSTGRGRDQERYNPNTYRNRQQTDGSVPQNIPATEVPTEENWDNECINPPVEQKDTENVDNKQEENVEIYEEPYIQDEEYYEEVAFQDYEEGEEEYLEATGDGYEVYTEVNEENPLLKESEGDAEINLEENLVITSTIPQQHEEDGKRTVRFKLDKEENVITGETLGEEVEPIEKPKVSKGERERRKHKDKELVTQKSEEKNTKHEQLKCENALKSKVGENVTPVSKDALPLEKEEIVKGNSEDADKENSK